MRTLYMSCAYCGGSSVITTFDGALSGSCPFCMDGASPVANFNYVAAKKLDELVRDGFHISGVSIQKEIDGHIKRGFVTDGGMVCWWRSDEERASWGKK